MEKKSNIVKIVVKEVHRMTLLPGDRIRVEMVCKEPMEVIVNKIKIVYE